MRGTQRGWALARKLGPGIGFSPQTHRICSLICRNTASWHTLAEKLPAEGAGRRPAPGNLRIVLQLRRTEKRLETLVRSLPETECGPWRLDLTSGPGGNGLLLPPDGCTCVRCDDQHGRGVVIP